MKAHDLAKCLTEFAPLLKEPAASKGLRFLASAILQLPATTTASKALAKLDGLLLGVSHAASSDAARFKDINSTVQALSKLVQISGTKGAAEAAALLVKIAEGYPGVEVRVCEDLLAPPATTGRQRVIRVPAEPNEAVVAEYLAKLAEKKPGDAEFLDVWSQLKSDRKATAVEVAKIAVARGADFGKSAGKPTIMKALRMEHDLVVTARAKMQSGSNAA
jgi:hypothetical protein